MGTWKKLAYYTDITGTNLANLSGIATQFLNGLGAFSVPAGGGPPPVRKTADEIVNNSAVLQNDDHLLLAVGANEVWLFQLFIMYSSGTVPDIKFGWSYPVGCDIKWQHVFGWDGSPFLIQEETATLTFSGIALPAIIGTYFTAIVTNGANAGNVNLMWAQNTQNASDTTVLTNSCLIANKLA